MIRRYSFRTLLLFGVMSLCYSIQAQEFLTGMGTNPQIIKESQKQHKERADLQPMFLPFFEDFSNYTGYPNQNLFVDKQAFVNNSFPVRPPTIGVATLDALDEFGRVYKHLNQVSKGADTLTSRYIRLDSLWVAGTLSAIKFDEDSVYFSFYFQPGGASIKAGDVAGRIGSQPNATDSLVLEFGYWKMEQDTAYMVWNHIWSTPGFSVDEWNPEKPPYQYFKQILIPITNTKYSSDKFKFRFRNYASLEPQQGIAGWEGNVDQWHIDYIRLDVKRSPHDTTTNDLAFVTPTTSFLQNYQSMPWKQFHEDDMKKNFTNELTNLSEGDRESTYQYFITKGSDVYSHPKTGSITVYAYIDSGISKKMPLISPDIPIKKIKEKIPSLTPLTDTTTLKITHIFQNAAGIEHDFCTANDTCIFKQKFYDYYAYDDGTAEFGYCLNNQFDIAKLAMNFKLRVPDSLSAVRMWFNHTKNSENKDAQFKIVVWADDNGQPGTMLFDTEEYRPDTSHFHDFVEYKFDKKYYIEEANKNFWVGFEQRGNVQLNIGFDQNNDSKEFFKYNTNGDWETSSFKGTPMLRPVFGEPIHFVNVPTPKTSDIKIYPNPTSGELRIEIAGQARNDVQSVEVFDVYGRKHSYGLTTDGAVINISHLNSGIYFVKITTENGVVVKKIVKN